VNLGLRDANDLDIFERAKAAGAILISRDSDFVELISRFGPPPQLLWVTCGNVTNQRLRQVFATVFNSACSVLDEGRAVIEIGDRP
jgi:predicted nuclease of predicted toxin-antitoxin system